MGINNREGITSVFVVLLTLVLLLFGVGVLTITRSNENLAQRKQGWINDYYSLEGQMAEEFSKLYRDLKTIQKDLEGSVNFLEDYKSEIQKNYTISMEKDRHYIILEVPENGDHYLKAKLEILMPKVTMSFDKFYQASPLKLVSYQEKQGFFDYEDIPFENPFIPKGNE